MNSKETPIRVVIIDDQAAIRQALAAILEAEPDIQVVGRAGDGEEGLKVVFQVQPDVILLDLEMPRLDGFAFLRLLMAKRPTPVVVVSSHSSRESVFKALELGALEFVAKPGNVRRLEDLQGIRSDLLTKLRLARRLQVVTLTENAQASWKKLAAHAASKPSPAPLPQADAGAPPHLLCIGASSGGPTSILNLLLSLEPGLPAALLITQHMPERFTTAFAERLSRATPHQVREAQTGDLVTQGMVLLAPGSGSLRVERQGSLLRVLPPDFSESRDEGFVPSVDRMLEAAAAAMGAKVVAVILTGMAGDGVKGALTVRRAGGRVLCEAPESAVISGMPEEVIRSGAADEVVPLSRMAEAIRRAIWSQHV
jgi:two-component system chemotaxis response regulator CheB